MALAAFPRRMVAWSWLPLAVPFAVATCPACEIEEINEWVKPPGCSSIALVADQFQRIACCGAVGAGPRAPVDVASAHATREEARFVSPALNAPVSE